MKIEELNHSFYGRCIRLSAGGIRLITTVDVGPRIVYYGDKNNNVLYNDRDNLINKGGPYFDKNFKKGERWRIYGGHRLWKSPEDLATYVPDNYPCTFEVVERGIRLISPVEKMTGLLKTITITMTENGDVKLEHSFTNKGRSTSRVSLWAITVMEAGGKALVPLCDQDTGFLPNRNLVYWPYSQNNDPRLRIMDQYLTLEQERTADRAFKVGLFNRYGVLGYYRRSTLFIKRFTGQDSLQYPDYQCNAELYTDSYILELETLSPLCELKTGEITTHTEQWSFKNIRIDHDLDLYKAVMKEASL